jgi:hypothetical protein
MAGGLESGRGEAENGPMSEVYVVCRPAPGTQAELEVAATFGSKDQAVRELDRLNLIATPQAPSWRLLVKHN